MAEKHGRTEHLVDERDGILEFISVDATEIRPEVADAFADLRKELRQENSEIAERLVRERDSRASD
jgi:hypothetical protein